MVPKFRLFHIHTMLWPAVVSTAVYAVAVIVMSVAETVLGATPLSDEQSWWAFAWPQGAKLLIIAPMALWFVYQYQLFARDTNALSTEVGFPYGISLGLQALFGCGVILSLAALEYRACLDRPGVFVSVPVLHPWATTAVWAAALGSWLSAVNFYRERQTQADNAQQWMVRAVAERLWIANVVGAVLAAIAAFGAEFIRWLGAPSHFVNLFDSDAVRALALILAAWVPFVVWIVIRSTEIES